MSPCTFTTVRIADIQIPIERFTFVANATSNTFLALAQFTGWHRATARETRRYASRITVAFFAGWVVVETLFAATACLLIEVTGAQTLALRIARNTDRTRCLTIAS